MKKSIMEKLGLTPVRKLSKSVCRERVLYLRRRIDKEDIPSRLMPHAKYYANWYAWMLKNGGTRSSSKRRVA